MKDGGGWKSAPKITNIENQPFAGFVQKSRLTFWSSGIKAVLLHPLSPKNGSNAKKVIFERLFD